MQLKVKFIIVFNLFTPTKQEITPSGSQHIQPRGIFWFLLGIKKQTISDWAKEVHDYVCEGVPYHGDSPKNVWKLAYAFWGAILVESSKKGAYYFMLLAGYICYKVPEEHPLYQTPTAACYRVIDYVYENSPELKDDDNDSRMARLDLAESYIRTSEPSLLDIF